MFILLLYYNYHNLTDRPCETFGCINSLFLFSLYVCVCVPGGGDSHTLPIQVRAAQRGRDFKAPGLERGIHFRGVF